MNTDILNTIDKDITLLLDNLPIGIIRLNHNKQCIYVNKFIYDFFKISQTQNESSILYEIFRRIHPGDVETFRHDDQQFLLNNIENDTTFRIWNDEFTDNWTWINSRRILIKNEDSINYMYTFQDINETKTMEIQLRNERLKVEKAYNHKSVFLANMSHEIRTPIHGIVGMLTLLSDTGLSSEQNDYINMIKECSFNLMAIINDILDYSKLEIGKIVLENKPINIQQCIESINDIIISRVIEKSIDYSYNKGDGVPLWINGDCNRLKQIVLNLISNSIKFTDSGSVFLNIEKITKKNYILLKRHSKYEMDESDNIDDPDNIIYLRFDVTDTGCGIDITEKDKLFKSFSQIDNHVTNKIYQGTGLGLAICKELTELMGGYIWLDWSERNGGSRFSFVIQTTEVHGIQEEQYLPQETILQDVKVLILDNNVHNRISLTGMVNKWGMKAYAFSNIEEALYFAKITQFDIGLIDLTEGITFAKKLREIDEFNNKNMPLIALSSLGEKIPEKDTQFECYLTKPIKEMRLKQKCQEIINNIRNKEGEIVKLSTTNKNSNNILDSVLGEHIRSSVRILLAEDIYINQKVISSFLNKLGFTDIKVAENGAECLELLKDHEFDLVLLDIRMPFISGDVIVKEIIEYYNRNNCENSIYKFKNKKKPYLIAVTAYCLKEDKAKYLQMGFDDYIPKPIDLSFLSTCLNKFVSKLLKE